jgi:hypothetical protein
MKWSTIQTSRLHNHFTGYSMMRQSEFVNSLYLQIIFRYRIFRLSNVQFESIISCNTLITGLHFIKSNGLFKNYYYYILNLCHYHFFTFSIFHFDFITVTLLFPHKTVVSNYNLHRLPHFTQCIKPKGLNPRFCPNIF